MAKYVSKVTVAVCSILFLLGVVEGQLIYMRRSSILKSNDLAANAIALHWILAAALLVTLIISIFYWRTSKKPYIVWLAPFTKGALQRVKDTVTFRNGASFIIIVRALLVAMLTIVALFYFLRAGMQVLAARDPNFTANAWGGPSYWGASLAHWMDAVILFYMQVWIISLLAVKPKSITRKK